MGGMFLRVDIQKIVVECHSWIVFPTSTREFIFIFKELVFLERMFFKNFDQPNMRNLKYIFLHTKHTEKLCISAETADDKTKHAQEVITNCM